MMTDSSSLSHSVHWPGAGQRLSGDSVYVYRWPDPPPSQAGAHLFPSSLLFTKSKPSNLPRFAANKKYLIVESPCKALVPNPNSKETGVDTEKSKF